MGFSTSQVSFTGCVQAAVLATSEGMLTQRFAQRGSPAFRLLASCETALISRIASLFLTPAALLDFTFHTCMLPGAVLWAAGKSLILRRADFILPWQHLQRVRDAVCPILFGSMAGIIHPYLGIYCSEPKIKHVAAGYLLSGTDKDVPVVVSPATAISETDRLLRKLPKRDVSEGHFKLLQQAGFWERSLEKIQSIELFDLRLGQRILQPLVEDIAASAASPGMKALAKRVLLLALPVLSAVDLAGHVLFAGFAFSCYVVQLFGGRVPAYMEATNNPLLHLYNVAKIALSAFSATAGVFIGLASPELALALSCPSSKRLGFISLLLEAHMLILKRQMNGMGDGERLLLPIVVQGSAPGAALTDCIPSFSSHMMYLLIEKRGAKFAAELIERGANHGSVRGLSAVALRDLVRDCFSLRFQTLMEQVPCDFLSSTFKGPKSLELGTQGNTTNCVITNLFAALEVADRKDGKAPLDCARFKMEVIRSYDYFSRDFFPFAPVADVIAEIANLESSPVI